MKIVQATLLYGAMACALWSPNLLGQDVQVASENGVTTLSMTAQKPYVSGQTRTPVLSVICRQKGKKFTHAIAFAPAGFLTQQDYSPYGKSSSLVLKMSIAGHKQTTTWVSQENPFQSFEYVGKTEPERIQFLQTLLGVPTVTIEFTPFLTGAPASSTFDLTGLRTEFDKHPECTVNMK